jgi:5-methylcytosine-specific restriction endonuclease McrA
MSKYRDSLRGYAFEVMKRDNFTCRYCGLNGSRDFTAWLSMSWDHLLPKGHPDRDNPEYIVTACNFCNTADNKYFDNAAKRDISFIGLSQMQLIAQRKTWVVSTRTKYHEFWLERVSKAT